MAYCKKCGKQIEENASFCNYCGAPQITVTTTSDSGNIGWGILSFFFPIVGLILFLVWRKNKPKNSKVSGIAALCSVGIYLLFVVLLTFALPLSSIRF